jgi:transglutaminase-like putative cysteine protease
MRIHIGLAAGAALAAAAAGCASAGSGDAREHGPPEGFHARHAFAVTPPPGARAVRAWFALPQNEPDQEVLALTVECPHPWKVVPDDQGNWFLFVEAKGPDLAPFDAVVEFDLRRWEVRTRPDPGATRPLTDDERREMAPYLTGSANVPVNDAFRKLALEATGGEANPVAAARKLYDWTLRNVDYWVKHPDRLKASPVGSAEYCLSTKTGNCTDFHSLWTALARSSGIPTRMVYGSFFKKDLAGKDADQSYHCWIEFWAPGLGWIPHDVAVADLFVGDFEVDRDNEEKVRLTTAAGYAGKDPAMVDYYFGNIDGRRVVWHRGRDLRVEPGAAAGPINALPKAHVEADGTPLKEKEGWTRKLTFEEKKL